jgi:hypothetical protein
MEEANKIFEMEDVLFVMSGLSLHFYSFHLRNSPSAITVLLLPSFNFTDIQLHRSVQSKDSWTPFLLQNQLIIFHSRSKLPLETLTCFEGHVAMYRYNLDCNWLVHIQ